MIKFILFIGCFVFANPYSQWIKKYSDVLNNRIKTITFNVKIDSDLFIVDSLLKGKLTIGENKQFRFELGPRIIVSNGKVWKSYDIRTNQLILQNPDKRIEKALFSFLKYNSLKVVPIKLLHNGNYSLKFINKWSELQVSFNPTNGELQSIIINNNNIKSIVTSISLKEEKDLILKVGNENTEVFDFR